MLKVRETKAGVGEIVRLGAPLRANAARGRYMFLFLLAALVAAFAAIASPTPAEAAPPAAPTGLAATLGGGQMALSWTNPNDGSITRYQYMQKVGDGEYGSWIDLPNSELGGDNTIPYVASGPDNNVDYTFHGPAVHQAGESAQSLKDSPVHPMQTSPALVLSSTDVDVDEGSTATYTVALATLPSAKVIVTVTSGWTGQVTAGPADLTFAATDWDEPQTVTLTGVEDISTNDWRITITHSASGGGYEGITGTVYANVADNDPTPVAFSVGTLTLTERSTTTYTVALVEQPAGNISVFPISDNGNVVTTTPFLLPFTPSNWDTPQEVTVTAVPDINTGAGVTHITHGVSGLPVVWIQTHLRVEVTDYNPPGFVFSTDGTTQVEGSASTSLDEDSTATYTVALLAPPSGNVTVRLTNSDTTAAIMEQAMLTFTTGDWNIPKEVTVTGVADTDTDDARVTITHTASGGGYADVTGTVAASVTDNTRALTISADSLEVREGSAASYTVKLANEPTAEVTVTVESGDTSAATVDKAKLTFTTATWDDPQTVTVTAVSDTDSENESVVITHSASGGGYAGVTAKVTAQITDATGQGFIMSTTSVAVDEGSTAIYTVAVAKAPTADVTVTVESGDTTAATVDKVELTFTTTTWEDTQTVTVNGIADVDLRDETVRITHEAEGGDYTGVVGTVTANVTDTTTPSLVLTPNELELTEGDTVRYTVALGAPPNGDVTVRVGGWNAETVTVDIPPDSQGYRSLTFTTENWEIPKTVRVTIVHDADADDWTGSLSHTPDGGGYEEAIPKTVTLTVTDDDQPGLVFSADTVVAGEGLTATYTLALATKPAEDVTVTVSSDDTAAATVDPDEFTIPRLEWDQPRTVTVTGVADTATAEITLTAAGGGYDGVTGAVMVTVYEPATTTGGQSTHGVPADILTIVRPSNSGPAVEFPSGATTGNPFQVRVDPAPLNCVTGHSSRTLAGCVQVDLFTLDGNVWDEDADGTAFPSATVKIVVTSIRGISVHRRAGPSDPWTTIPRCAGEEDTRECFTVSGNEVTIRNIQGFSQFAVARAPAARRDRRDDDRDDRSVEAPVYLAPVFVEGVATTREVAENSPAGTLVGGPITATANLDQLVTYSGSGPDAELFDVATDTGQILVAEGAAFNYESARRTYDIEVVASTVAGPDSTITLTIRVINVDEAGAVTLSPVGPPEVGKTVTATLTDPDEGVFGESWSWQRSADGTTWSDIIGANSETYTPVGADAGMQLRARVTYADSFGAGLILTESTPAVAGAPQPAATPTPEPMATPEPTLEPSPSAPEPTVTPPTPAPAPTAEPTPTATLIPSIVVAATPRPLPPTPTPWAGAPTPAPAESTRPILAAQAPTPAPTIAAQPAATPSIAAPAESQDGFPLWVIVLIIFGLGVLAVGAVTVFLRRR